MNIWYQSTLDCAQHPNYAKALAAHFGKIALLASEEANSGAMIAASFSEPILPELRGLAKIPVVSMSEACFVAATISAPENYRKPTGEASL